MVIAARFSIMFLAPMQTDLLAFWIAFSKSINKSNSNILRKVSQKWIQAVLQARTYGVTNSLINLLLLALRRYTFSRTRSKSEGEEY